MEYVEEDKYENQEQVYEKHVKEKEGHEDLHGWSSLVLRVEETEAANEKDDHESPGQRRYTY